MKNEIKTFRTSHCSLKPFIISLCILTIKSQENAKITKILLEIKRLNKKHYKQRSNKQQIPSDQHEQQEVMKED